jgi:hypothetical protein
MAKRDDRTFIFVHDGMPEHWKVEDLSDSAFRLMVTLWCWCSRQRTDGRVPPRKWLRSGSDSDKSELVDNGLFELTPDGGAVVHDYLEHQRSRDDIRKRSQAAQKANHIRHHVRTGNWNPNCDLCIFPGHDPTPPSPSDSDSESDPNPVHKRTPTESQSRAEQSRVDISQSARTREAGRLLGHRYGLTDQESAAVIQQVHQRATQPITHLARYLEAMAEGDLADIVKAVMDAADRSRPPLAAVPDLPAEPPPPARPAGAPPPTQALDELRAEKGWKRAAP